MKKANFIPIHIKVLVSLLLLSMFFAAFCFVAITGSENFSAQRSLEKRASLMADGLVCMSRLPLEEAYIGDPQAIKQMNALREHVAQMSQEADVAYLRVLNHKRLIKASSTAQENGQEVQDALVTKVLNSHAPNARLTVNQGRQVLEILTPISHGELRLGVVQVGFFMTDAQVTRTHTMRILCGLLCILVAGIFLFTAFFTHFFSNPLLTLTSVARDLSLGKLSKRAEDERSDEIGQISRSLNELAAFTQKKLQRLEQAHSNWSDRIKELRLFADDVIKGETQKQIVAEDLDELGQLTMSVNEMARHLHMLTKEELSNRELKERQQSRIRELESKTLGGQEAAPASSKMMAPLAPLDQETSIVMTAPPPKPKQDQPSVKNSSLDAETIFSVPTHPKKGAQPRPSPQQDLNATIGVGMPAQRPIQAPIRPVSPSLNQLSGLPNQPVPATPQPAAPISLLGSGRNVLISTNNNAEAQQFLKKVLESEGFTVLQAANMEETMDMAQVTVPPIVVLDYSDAPGGNRVAIQQLRSLEACASISLITMENYPQVANDLMRFEDVTPLVKGPALAQHLREALAEILLIGGLNPFVKK